MGRQALKEYFEDIALFLIFLGFSIFSKVAAVVLTIFFPITKLIVNKRLLNLGITVNGDKPTDIQVINELPFYLRLAIERGYGLLESKVDGDWEIEDFRGMFSLLMEKRKQKEFCHPLTWIFSLFNMQTPKKAWAVGRHHYDAGNEVIESMLDKNLQYTCGYWKEAKNLDEAQIAKMDLIARKLNLKPGMRVLDIGSGYGTLGHYLVKNYGVSFVGVNISKEQVKYSKELCKGMPNCEFRLCDYRDVKEKFDRIVSVGMFEHVGVKNYETFFSVCNNCLKDNGIFLLHTIGIALNSVIGRDMWVSKYIFRNAYTPHYMEICKAIQDQFVIEDWHNFGHDYSLTLNEWENNFDKAWPRFRKQYGEKFYKVWKMYLRGSQVLFETRALNLWQIVLSKDGIRGGYESTR